jgi:hypothetical protein
MDDTTRNRKREEKTPRTPSSIDPNLLTLNPPNPGRALRNDFKPIIVAISGTTDSHWQWHADSPYWLTLLASAKVLATMSYHSPVSRNSARPRFSIFTASRPRLFVALVAKCSEAIFSQSIPSQLMERSKAWLGNRTSGCEPQGNRTARRADA